MIWLAGIFLLCAAGPALLFVQNLRVLSAPPASPSAPRGGAVLIPARDEEENIEQTLRAALASGANEILVLDDGSTDRTAEIVRQIAAEVPAVRLLEGKKLPAGWCGKNFACAQLAAATDQPVLIFVDADVQLAPGAAPRLAAFLGVSGAQLASGVPRQVTVTFSEQLLLPLIHFVLLGFLPLQRMRRSRHPAYGAGCGQLFVADAAAYRASGGHGAIRGRIHEGLELPKQFRRHGYGTDLFDPTELASCRMYRRARDVWRGLTKNTHEGLGAPAVILPMTFLLLAGQVAPFVLLVLASTWEVRLLAALGCGLALLPRLLGSRRFRQPLASVVLHPLGVVALLGIQWFGLIRYLRGRPANWKGRTYSPLASRVDRNR
ncbi:MAG: glycosyltransferase [Spartobacteria bacterium]